MLNIFDAYELRARLFPALLVFLPIWITASVIGLWAADARSTSIVGAMAALPLLYCGSMLVRQFGRSIESGLWKSWDGPPTTRFFRWRDTMLAQSQKMRLHRVTQEQFGISLASPQAESNDPLSADQSILQAVREIQAVLRQKDKDGLWSKHLAEYGFSRNLLGSRRWLVGAALLGLFTCGGLLAPSLHGALVAGCALNGVILIAAIYLGWHQLPRIAATAADRYAESLLSSFLALNPLKEREK